MVLLTAYVLLRSSPRLEASLTYAYLTYPTQFSERISKASEQLKYEQLQGRINSIGQGGLSHDQVERLIEMAQAPYAQLFAKPFEPGWSITVPACLSNCATVVTRRYGR